MTDISGEIVTIVMPALNEERYIEQAIMSLLPDEPSFDYELLVMDGGSTDGTREIVDRLAATNPRIRYIHNEKRVQSAAVNQAARIADPRSRTLVRADCHAQYPRDFVETCLRELRARNCVSVVVPMNTVGVTCVQKAIASAQNSRLGNGGSAHRLAGQSGYVEHGHHAGFNRDAFLAVGGYDETMPFNEDAELDVRLVAAGGRIWLSGEATIVYFPRATLSSLAKQYLRYGSGRASTWLLHGSQLRLRQILPFAILLACIGSIALSFFDPRFLFIASAYAMLCISWGLVLAISQGSACVALSGIAAMTMHLCWGAGFLMRVVRHASSKLKPSERHHASWL
jgi:succinoglycan biosynthesis protein ExoA